MSANYTQPKDCPVPKLAGYPNNTAKTNTKQTRGTGAATQGNKHSKNSQ